MPSLWSESRLFLEVYADILVTLIFKFKVCTIVKYDKLQAETLDKSSEKENTRIQK